MATAFDVAEYILQKTGRISTMKLQKLVYYSQAWSTVWDEIPDTPLFEEPIQAWINGPVVPALFEEHKGHFQVGPGFFKKGKADRLTENQKETIDSVLDFYGNRSAQWLSDLAHSEAPWVEARKGLRADVRGSREITLDSMQQYYGSLEE